LFPASDGKDIPALENPRQFFEKIDGAKLRLSRPRKFILLCGGIIAPDAATSPSAREEFLRSLVDRKIFDGHDVRLAEDIDAFYPDIRGKLTTDEVMSLRGELAFCHSVEPDIVRLGQKYGHAAIQSLFKKRFQPSI